MEPQHWPAGQLSYAHRHVVYDQGATVDPGVIVRAVMLAIVGGAGFLALLVVALTWPVVTPLCLAVSTVAGVTVCGLVAAKVYDLAHKPATATTTCCSAVFAAGGAPPGAEPPGGAGRPLDGRNNVSPLPSSPRGTAPVPGPGSVSLGKPHPTVAAPLLPGASR
jgi:hypothetical protein